MRKHYMVTGCLIVMSLLLVGCGTLSLAGSKVRETFEPPLVQADGYVQDVTEDSMRISTTAEKLAAGEEVTDEEKQELYELAVKVKTAAQDARDITFSLLRLVRMLPEPGD